MISSPGGLEVGGVGVAGQQTFQVINSLTKKKRPNGGVWGLDLPLLLPLVQELAIKAQH